MTHANIRGVNASLRKKEFKYVPGTKELYNLSWDPATKNVILLWREMILNYFQNLYFKEEKQDLLAHMDSYLNDWLEHIEKREIAIEKGKVKDSCYPEFERFN